MLVVGPIAPFLVPGVSGTVFNEQNHHNVSYEYQKKNIIENYANVRGIEL